MSARAYLHHPWLMASHSDDPAPQQIDDRGVAVEFTGHGHMVVEWDDYGLTVRCSGSRWNDDALVVRPISGNVVRISTRPMDAEEAEADHLEALDVAARDRAAEAARQARGVT